MNNHNPELKVTGLTRLPPDYKGEPCVLTIELYDKDGGAYESEIHMDAGFNPNSLREAVTTSMLAMDATPVGAYIKSFKIKK